MDEEVQHVEIINAVKDIFDAQEIKVKEYKVKSAAMIGEGDEDDAELSSSSRRRSSSSAASTIASHRDQLFAQVMSAFLPKPPPVYTPPSASDWFKEAGINDVQKAKLMLNFPAGAEPTPLLLASLIDEDLTKAELMPAQVRAFKKLQELHNMMPSK